jgi:hypothetical protein
MFVQAIPEVTSARTGIHMLWAGPRAWLYSPSGWTIQRRRFQRRFGEYDCVTLNLSDLARLRSHRELLIRHGALTLRDGDWVMPVAAEVRAAASGGAEVVTLAAPSRPVAIRFEVEASASFAVGLREGKPVAGGEVITGQATHELTAPELDGAVLYVQGLKNLSVCVLREQIRDWDEAPVVRTVQLPIRELMPSLPDADAEFAEAKSRLLGGEDLDRAEFESFTDLLRALVKADGPPRPLDLALVLRDRPDEDPQELSAMDPLRALILHPRWRRVMGFGWFDDDPTLLPGANYEYRITGAFPTSDLHDRVVGFHTVPSQTALPAEFYLGDVRLRFPQPVVVERTGPDTGERRRIARRGVRLAKQDQPWWQVPSLDSWSAAIDFPTAVTSLILDVEPGHELSFAAGAPWLPPGPAVPLPPGPRAQLTFAQPIHQLLLSGKGFLTAIRIRATTDPPDKEETVRVYTGAVSLIDAPLPDPPLFATLDNLQLPQAVPVVDQPAGPTPHPHDLGFQVRWRPATRAGVVAWPVDLAVPPPLDAAFFQIEHRQLQPATGDWTPVADEDNYTTGDRAFGTPTPEIHPGVDLQSVFPEVRPPSLEALDLIWRDVFDFDDAGDPSPDLPRPPPPPGTVHQYRLRAVDPIGRPSATWVETGPLRLEKHLPPPLPAAPDLTPADAIQDPTITGVRARVLVRDAPDLTDDEAAILAGHQNAIVLTWGWHEEQRRQDPFAREFRLYSTRLEPGRVRATIVSVVPQGDERFDCAIVGDRPFAADAATGTVIEAGALFRVLGHGAGPFTVLRLRALERDAGGAWIPPVPGAVGVPVRLSPDQTRPRFFAPRVGVVPIDGRTVYSHTFFDLLDLSPSKPTDRLHVGVSSADGEEYVADPLSPAATRPGNESPVVAVPCEGRWHGRPVVDDAPSLDPVPVIVTPEPGPRPLTFRLDLTAYAALPPGTLVRPERVPDDEVFAAYRADGDRVMARTVAPLPGEVEQEVVVPNAGDRAQILTALASGGVGQLEDRFVVFLAAAHPYRARLFQGRTGDPLPFGAFVETLPNRGARWVYRLRRADGSGRLSAEGLTVRAIVRTPATSELAEPVRVQRGAGTAVLRVATTSEVTDLLVFVRTLESRAAAREDAEILRIRSASGAAGDRVRLRLADGTLISPTVKSLADPDVGRDGTFRLVTVEAPAGPPVRIWACVATRDGFVSRPGGPWRVEGGATP